MKILWKISSKKEKKSSDPLDIFVDIDPIKTKLSENKEYYAN